MELKENEDPRECVNQMTTILATVTPTLSSDTLRLLRPQNSPLTTNLSGPDILLSSSRATAMDSHRILAVLDLAWRNSSLFPLCSAQALMFADTVSELTSPSGLLLVLKLITPLSP